MVMDVDNQLAPRDHNAPPLSEIITEALAPFQGRSKDLIQAAASARIVEDDNGVSAEKVINLSQMIHALENDLDRTRKDMKQPYLDACRAIDANFGAAMRPLVSDRAKLAALLNAYTQKRRAEEASPAPVRAHLGSLGTRREIGFEVEYPLKLVIWLLAQPMREHVEQALRSIMGAYLRQVGVDAVAKGVAIPGVKAWVDETAVIRR